MNTTDNLFPEPIAAARGDRHGTGILPSQDLRQLIRDRAILATDRIPESNIQPASLDLRLGPIAYRVRASFLPGKDATVRDKIEAFGMHEIDLTGGAVLEHGCVYIVPLMESVSLAKRVSGTANPKSSTGRLNVFSRLITDYGTGFDQVPEQYKGPLYAEISPLGFSVVVRPGSRLVQLRLRHGSPTFGEAALRRLQSETPLVSDGDGDSILRASIAVSLNLDGDPITGLVGYKARRDTDVVDVDAVGLYDPMEYWEPVHLTGGGGIILSPDDFYILSSKEAVSVPPDHAAEMIAYDTMVGEFRVHYAGFFDPGFGYGDGAGGTRAVLEVRSHEVPFLVEHGQVVCRLQYERLMAVPDKIYGTQIGSSYQRQGLALGKQFKRI